MEKLSRCVPCGGSGQVLGIGMIPRNCALCDGVGKIIKTDDEIGYLTDKNTDDHRNTLKYTQAKDVLRKKLTTKNYTPTDEHLESLLDKALGKK